MLNHIEADNVPAARGPYSHAVVAGDFVYTAGQIPVNFETGQLVGDDIHVQVKQVMLNLGQVLAASGATFAQVVKATVYLADMDDFTPMNTVYAEFMADHRPARACVEVAKLPLGCKVEIDLVAYTGD